MHEKAEKYLAEQAEKAEEKKQKHLISLGLWEKEFGEFEWGGEYDEETGKTYKKKAIAVPDEEYERIVKAQPVRLASSNPIAMLCTVLAWIFYIGGFIAGIVTGSQFGAFESGFSIIVAAGVWLNAFLIGTIFLVFSMMINLLQKIAVQSENNK